VIYRCRDCGEVFDEDEIVTHTGYLSEAWGRPIYETVSESPCCGGSYEEAKKCSICGQYEDMECGDKWCANCYTDIIKTFNQLMIDNFTEEAMNMLRELIDNGELII
jgi:hypothetical protein